MKNLVLMLCLLFSTAVFAGTITDQCPQLTVSGSPEYQPHTGDQEICHANYAVIHRCDVKAPVAVFEHLTKEDISGPAKRKDNFHPDSAVTPECSATLADYATVGKTHDRGHLSPAGNNTQSAEVMSESFDLSNMVAQIANNNRGIWKQLETKERDMISTPGTDYYVISGGIYDPGHPVTGKGLGIPTRLYKIIVEKNSKTVQAYLMPNAALPVADLPKYQVTLEEVEQATQMKFNLK
jgi:DNA/RNA endonuclease G (NUC1)